MNQSSVIQIASATDNTAPLRAGPFGPEARLSLQLAGRRIIICANIPEGALAIYQRPLRNLPPRHLETPY